MKTPIVRAACALSAMLGLIAPVAAQEAIWTPAATQPSAGTVISKHSVRIFNYHNDPTGLDRRGTDVVLQNTVSLGLTGTLSLNADVPIVIRQFEAARNADDPDRADLGDISLNLKWRFWQHDPGPVDTLRLAGVVGLETPTGADGLSSDSVDPQLGLVFTGILGRHGFNAAATWTLTTGGTDDPIMPGLSVSDALRADAAYLYRLDPAEYTAETAASLYAVAELNAVYETNGDYELFLSPGILYEARNFALEASVQIPVAAETDHRPERRYGLALGLRVLF
jgi:hypothetical protein